MGYQKYAIAILISMAAMLSGCMSRTITIDPIPELKIGSPLAGIKPVTFAVKEFEDARPVKNLVGACRVGPTIELDGQKVPEIITQAIINELKRNGHTVLQPGESAAADVIIEGIVRGYWIQHDNYTASIRITGTVDAEIRVAAGKNRDNALPKPYQGKYYFETHGLPSSALWQDVINQALLDMLKEFTTDEELLSKLQRISAL